MAGLPEVTGDTFDSEVLQSDVPVLVDLWRPGCGPCDLLLPTIERLAAKYEGRAKVVKMNVMDGPEVATKLGLRAVPALMVFKDGQMVDEAVGMVPADVLAGMLDAALDGRA